MSKRKKRRKLLKKLFSNIDAEEEEVYGLGHNRYDPEEELYNALWMSYYPETKKDAYKLLEKIASKIPEETESTKERRYE